MAKCNCLLSHQNGGVCNCQDNPDWDNYEEDEREEERDEKEDEEDKSFIRRERGRITTDWDDFLQ